MPKKAKRTFLEQKKQWDDLIANAEPLKDAEWTRIKKNSGMPDEARSEITTALRLYTSEKQNQDDVKQARKLIKEGSGKTRSLSRTLKDLALCPELYYGAFGSDEMYPRDLFRFLSNSRGHLTRIETVLSQAERRLMGNSGNIPYGPLSDLVKQLDGFFFFYTGAWLTQSRKKDKSFDYVSTALRIVEADIPDGTIAFHIKETIRNRSLLAGGPNRR